jgi:hypothetical protein
MKTANRLHQLAQNLRLASIVILSAIVTTATFPAIARTPSTSRPKSDLKIRWKPPIPPTSLGIPGNRAQGGGTRSGCQTYREITALVPQSPQQIAWGQTISDRPTVWLNAPQGLVKDLPIEIAVRSENGKPIAKQLLTLDRDIPPGAIALSLPPGTVLQVDRTYRWEVALYCDNEEQIDRPLSIQGEIQRIAPPKKIANAKSPLETAQILAENGIWYDAITQLGNGFRKNKDRQLAIAWSELLQAAGVSGSDRIQDCCQFDRIKK